MTELLKIIGIVCVTLLAIFIACESDVMGREHPFLAATLEIAGIILILYE